MQDSIKNEVTFKNEIETVWSAISREEEIKQWFLNADFKPETGYNYSYKSDGEDCTEINGIVKNGTPNHLSYTWVVRGTDVETLVNWKLEKVSEGTKLALEHTGISKYEESMAVKFFEDFQGGWNHCTDSLSKNLSK